MLEKSSGDLVILYEDEAVLAVEKPANVPVHPSGRHMTRAWTGDCGGVPIAWVAAGTPRVRGALASRNCASDLRGALADGDG